MNLADLRLDYRSRSLSEEDTAETPIAQFSRWWEEVMSSGIEEPNAMTLATAGADGLPSARIVLLKGFDERGFVFFSHYESYKGLQLGENPKAALVFFWKELERQVRVTGLVRRLPPAESDAYYASRPEGSRIGAWASPQSRVIPGREWLEEKVQDPSLQERGRSGERPPFWGGYLVQPVVVEFWQGRSSRLHDRIQYTLEGEGKWVKERLAP